MNFVGYVFNVVKNRDFHDIVCDNRRQMHKRPLLPDLIIPGQHRGQPQHLPSEKPQLKVLLNIDPRENRFELRDPGPLNLLPDQIANARRNQPADDPGADHDDHPHREGLLLGDVLAPVLKLERGVYIL